MRSLIIYLAGVNLEKSTKSHQTMELTIQTNIRPHRLSLDCIQVQAKRTSRRRAD
jgi:hypothetical protein